MTLKLNLGCGYNKKEGFINVDEDPLCAPDVLLDLNDTTIKWPWEDSSVDEIELCHVLEHLGPTTASYKHLWQQIYRICKHNAYICILVPHPKHDTFLHDPTHIRVITAEGFGLFDQEHNREQIKNKGRETTLGLMWGIDFIIHDVNYKIGQAANPQWTQEELNHALRHYNNIAYETSVILKARKNV